MLPESEFFKPSELACKDGTPYPEAWFDRYTILVLKLADPIRRLWAGPLLVVSGYRTQAYNDGLIKEGHHPASQSQHIEGRAMDIAPLNATPQLVEELHDRILDAYLYHQLPYLGGLGLYPGWVHIDTAKSSDGHLRRWNIA